MPKNTPGAVHRGERILAYMAASIVVVSVLCFFALLIGRLAGVDNFTLGVWPIVSVLPLIGLPIAIILIISLVVVGGIRRSRESAASGAGGSARSGSARSSSARSESARSTPRASAGARAGAARPNARGTKGGETGRQSKDARR